MVKGTLRSTALSVAALALVAIGGCRTPQRQQPAAPPMAAEPAQPPQLMGGPSGRLRYVDTSADQPREPQGPMAPIPDPEDMSPEQRHAIYGDKYDPTGHASLWHAHHITRAEVRHPPAAPPIGVPAAERPPPASPAPAAAKTTPASRGEQWTALGQTPGKVGSAIIVFLIALTALIGAMRFERRA